MSKRNLLVVLCLVIAAIVVIYASRSQPMPVPYEVISAAEIASHARYERALEKRTTLKFEELPLDQAIQQIASKAGVSMQIDTRALEDASIGAQTPVTLTVSGITLRSALKLLLNRMDLTWILQDETLIVTTPEKAGNELIIVVYPVFDLVAGPSKSPAGMANYQQLIDLLRAGVSPTQWDQDTRPIEDRSAGALVIAQTREVHTEVGLLLTALRQARDAQGILPGKTITNSSTWPWRPAGMGGGTFVPTAPVVPQSAPTARPRPTGNAAPPMTPTPNSPVPKNTPQ